MIIPIIPLLIATVAISACTPKQTDAHVPTEETGAMEDRAAAEDEEKEYALQTENMTEEEESVKKESAERENAAVEGESFPEKSTGKLRFYLNIAELRPEEAWAVGDNKVYFGKFEGIPVAYRVLPAATNTQKTDNGEDCLYLDCDSVLLTKEFDADNKLNAGQTKRQNEWKGSDLETWLNGNDFWGNSAVFSDIERAAIAGTVLSECSEAYLAGRWTYQDFGATDYVFLLSAAEAKQLYANDAARAKTGSNTSWWIRSAFAEAGQGAGAIHEDGHICNNSVNNFSNGVSPALNISLSSVFLVSAVKTEDDCRSEEWKMTLIDTGKAVQVTDGQVLTRTDSEKETVITVPYIYTGADINRISVMITDKVYTEKGAQVLFYDALQGMTGDCSTGTGVFILPFDLKNQICQKDYHVYLIAEKVNGDKRTDYAGEPCEIMIPTAE